MKGQKMASNDWGKPHRPIPWYARRDLDVKEKSQTTYKQRRFLEDLGMNKGDIKKLTREQAKSEIKKRLGHSSSSDDDL